MLCTVSVEKNLFRVSGGRGAVPTEKSGFVCDEEVQRGVQLAG